VIDERIASELDAHFEEDLERSVRVEPGQWERRSLWQRTAEAALKDPAGWHGAAVPVPAQFLVLAT